jgi:peptide/nickel transport system ATP-binding protein
MALLEVRDLSTSFHSRNGVVRAVDNVSFDLDRGETLGIVGESGSGKSVTCYSLLRLIPEPPGRIDSGSVVFDGEDLLKLSPNRLRAYRGKRISMIFQDPMTSLNPYLKISTQMIEPLKLHTDLDDKTALNKAIAGLEEVGIADAARRVHSYPHEFSGGMRQRVMIATALITEPDLLIADEPTTALDVTVQAQILDLLQELQRDFGSAIIIITHDLGVVAETADDVMVMYGGRAVEYGTAKEVLTRPQMPYTWGLLSSIPDLGGDTTKRLKPIPGAPPSLLAPPDGCLFHPRCRHSDEVPGDLCFRVLPALEPGRPGSTHLKRCHLPDPDAVYEAEYASGQYVGKTAAPVEDEVG